MVQISLIIYSHCVIAEYCISYLVTSKFQFSSCTLSVYLRSLVVSFVNLVLFSFVSFVDFVSFVCLQW